MVINFPLASHKNTCEMILSAKKFVNVLYVHQSHLYVQSTERFFMEVCLAKSTGITWQGHTVVACYTFAV